MKRIVILLTIIAVTIIGTALWWKNGLSPVDKSDKAEKIFIVKNGAGLKEIANKLKSEEIIKSSIVFFLYSRFNKLEGKIQAGDFRLSPSMTTPEIAENLTHGMLDVWVTIPEGKRAEEIAAILSEKLPNYNESWNTSLAKNEGYLFPDTYSIPRNADINLVLSILKGNFEKKFSELSFNSTNKFTKNEIVTIASMIEREAKFPADRSLIASVIYNRLDLDMPLQIDATVQYALGYSKEEKTWWIKNLTYDDLEIGSFYNTYKITGVPQGPISNPGLASLKAAVNPANTNYIYYVSDQEGHLYFAKTLNEHNANIQKYLRN